MKNEKTNPRGARAPKPFAKPVKHEASDRDERESAIEDTTSDVDPEPELAEFVDPEADSEESSADSRPTLVRLNKYLADHGIASRRKCDELIAAGQVTIDGNATTALGQTIDPTKHTVEIDGFILKPQGLRRRYYLLNKPAGVVCTNEPRETRPRAVDLITDARKGRIYTVGRLDEESKGLILLTNDGDFANRIMHPRYGVEKTYLVRVAGKIDDDALTKIREGVHLAEGRTAGARILVNKRLRDESTLTLTLREGMNREIRRAFAHVGYKVVDLRRTQIGPLSARGIKIGRWRELTSEEVAALLAGRNDSLDGRDRERRGGDGRDHDHRGGDGRDREHAGDDGLARATRGGRGRAGEHSGRAGRHGDRRAGHGRDGSGGERNDSRRAGAPRARSPREGTSHERRSHGVVARDRIRYGGLARGDKLQGDRPSEHAGRGGSRRPKVRSGLREFKDRARAHAEKKHGAGRVHHGRPAAGRGSARPGRGTHPESRGIPRAALGARRDEGRPGAPRRSGGGPGAHARMQKSMHDRRPAGAGLRNSPRGDARGRGAPFGKRSDSHRSGGNRSGKPAHRSANRRG